MQCTKKSDPILPTENFRTKRLNEGRPNERLVQQKGNEVDESRFRLKIVRHPNKGGRRRVEGSEDRRIEGSKDRMIEGSKGRRIKSHINAYQWGLDFSRRSVISSSRVSKVRRNLRSLFWCPKYSGKWAMLIEIWTKLGVSVCLVGYFSSTSNQSLLVPSILLPLDPSLLHYFDPSFRYPHGPEKKQG